MQIPPQKRKQTKMITFNPKKYETPALSLQQVNQMKEAFDFFNIDKRGSLQMNEIKKAMQILGSISVNKDNFNNLFLLMEENGDQNLNFNEFMEIISGNIAKNDQEEDLRIVFQDFLDLGNEKSLVDDNEQDDDFSSKQKIKKNKNKKSKNKINVGNSEIKITIEMLKNISRQIGETVEDEDLVEMLDKADKDEDGFVGFNDFQYIIQWESPEKKKKLYFNQINQRTSEKDSKLKIITSISQSRLF